MIFKEQHITAGCKTSTSAVKLEVVQVKTFSWKLKQLSMFQGERNQK